MKRLWLLPALFVLNAAVASEIVWLRSDHPPAAIESGPDASQGYADQEEAFIRNRLSDFTHRTDWLPLNRILNTLKFGGPYCTLGLTPTPERAKSMRFTSPIGWIYPNGVIVRRDELARFSPYLDAEQRLNLSLLAQDARFRGGLKLGRTYGPALDKAVQAAKDDHRIDAVNHLAVALGMLRGRRIDYTLAYPGEFAYSAKQQGEYAFLSTVEASALIPHAAACSLDSSADAAFAAIQRVVDERTMAAFLQAYERWLPPDFLPRYRKLLVQHRRTNQAPLARN